MKKIKYIIIIVILGYLGTVYYVDGTDQRLAKKRATKMHADNVSLLRMEAFSTLNKNGCQYCHTNKSELPFYANVPIAKQVMQHDIKNALRQFNIENIMQNIKANKPVSEVDLAKLESVLKHNEMPPSVYLSMHWRSRLSDDEKNILLLWIKSERRKNNPHSTASKEFINDVIQPITTQFNVEPDKVKLGEMLFFDKRISGDNTLSCASCHSLHTGGVDNLTTATGIGGTKGPINVPTVFNSAFNIHQFWDGRADDLQAQAGGPALNPIEMGSHSWTQIINKLSQDPNINAKFIALYTDGMTGENIKNAIAEFEKTLITPNSRFDQYLSGNKNALNTMEKEGYELFKSNNCTSCHAGESMGGKSYEIMGLKGDYFSARGHFTKVDNGRLNVTSDPNDLHRFKVPTLRNIALTAPYFHDGSVKTLNDAVRKMALYQVGVQLSPQDTNKITAFLKTLTGEYKGEILK